MIAVEAGAEDVEINDETFELYTAATELHAVSQALNEAGLEYEEATLSEVPKNEIELGSKETMQVMGVIEALEELDDVDQVYSGLSISDEALAELETA
jgi:transcriptional/translational regulatory protein YebC/TACO1